MTMKKSLTLFCMFLLFGVEYIFADPFGIEFGMTKEEIEKHGTLLEIESNEFYSGYEFIPQKKHPYFETYYIFIGKDEGLVKLGAISSRISDTGYGTNTKSKYNAIKYSLEKNYGKTPSEIDYNSSDIWNEAEDWMASLSLGHRQLSCLWVTKDNKGYDLFIILEAKAESFNTGVLLLTYESSKFREIFDKESDVL